MPEYNKNTCDLRKYTVSKNMFDLSLYAKAGNQLDKIKDSRSHQVTIRTWNCLSLLDALKWSRLKPILLIVSV